MADVFFKKMSKLNQGYYAWLTKVGLLWRDYCRAVYQEWIKVYGAKEAMEIAMTLPPKCCATRWLGVTYLENPVIRATITKLRLILFVVLRKRLNNKTHRKKGPKDHPDEIAIEDTQKHIEKLGRWSKEVMKGITSKYIEPTMLITGAARGPFNHTSLFLKSLNYSDDGHLATLVDYKAAEIANEFNLMFKLDSDMMSAIATVSISFADEPNDAAQIKGFACLQILLGHSGFRRRVLDNVEAEPLCYLGMGTTQWDTFSAKRKQLAQDLLSNAEHGHATGRKLVHLFREDVEHAAKHGTFATPNKLSTIICRIRKQAFSDVRQNERLHSMISLMVGRAPSMSLSLLTAKLQLKGALGTSIDYKTKRLAKSAREAGERLLHTLDDTLTRHDIDVANADSTKALADIEAHLDVLAAGDDHTDIADVQPLMDNCLESPNEAVDGAITKYVDVLKNPRWAPAEAHHLHLAEERRTANKQRSKSAKNLWAHSHSLVLSRRCQDWFQTETQPFAIKFVGTKHGTDHIFFAIRPFNHHIQLAVAQQINGGHLALVLPLETESAIDTLRRIWDDHVSHKSRRKTFQVQIAALDFDYEELQSANVSALRPFTNLRRMYYYIPTNTQNNVSNQPKQRPQPKPKQPTPDNDLIAMPIQDISDELEQWLERVMEQEHGIKLDDIRRSVDLELDGGDLEAENDADNVVAQGEQKELATMAKHFAAKEQQLVSKAFKSANQLEVGAAAENIHAKAECDFQIEEELISEAILNDRNHGGNVQSVNIETLVELRIEKANVTISNNGLQLIENWSNDAQNIAETLDEAHHMVAHDKGVLSNAHMSLVVVDLQPELVQWTQPNARKGRVAPIDPFDGVVSICNARVSEKTYSGQVLLPNSGHSAHKIKEGKSKAHKSGEKQNRPKLSPLVITLRAVWSRCLQATTQGLVAATPKLPKCSLCDEQGEDVCTCAICGRSYHSDCDIVLQSSMTKDICKQIDGMGNFHFEILPNCSLSSSR